MNNELVKFIINWKWELKKRGVPKRNWRPKIVQKAITEGILKSSEDFIEAWDYVNQKKSSNNQKKDG